MIDCLRFLNNPKDLDLSYKTDLDFWGCFGGKKNSVLKPKKYVKDANVENGWVIMRFVQTYFLFQSKMGCLLLFT